MRRDTLQRNAIRKVLVNAGRPLSVDELFGLAQNEVAGLGIATIYRNLRALRLGGQIEQVDLPGQPPRWEVVSKGHHHHFLCRTCDKLFEIQGCPENINHLLPEGYTLEEHDILLRGLCDACTERANSHVKNQVAQK
jgi:Fur family ferric uptake transcriptional regulator